MVNANQLLPSCYSAATQLLIMVNLTHCDTSSWFMLKLDPIWEHLARVSQGNQHQNWAKLLAKIRALPPAADGIPLQHSRNHDKVVLSRYIQIWWYDLYHLISIFAPHGPMRAILMLVPHCKPGRFNKSLLSCTLAGGWTRNCYNPCCFFPGNWLVSG